VINAQINKENINEQACMQTKIDGKKQTKKCGRKRGMVTNKDNGIKRERKRQKIKHTNNQRNEENKKKEMKKQIKRRVPNTGKK
jgi:hypothetical protein